ncbi:hypothetical protein QPX96_04495 [Limosilactobacillus fermentum]|nr:hypothetical protein [Limosilactobacillus fermentum]
MTEINDQELMHKLMKTVKGLHKRVHGSGPMGASATTTNTDQTARAAQCTAAWARA